MASTSTVIGSLRLADGKAVIRMEDRFATDARDLWSALTDPGRLARWIAQVDGDLRVGGEIHAVFTSGWEGPGRIEVCEPPSRLLAPDVTGRGGRDRDRGASLSGGLDDATRRRRAWAPAGRGRGTRRWVAGPHRRPRRAHRGPGTQRLASPMGRGDAGVRGSAGSPHGGCTGHQRRKRLTSSFGRQLAAGDDRDRPSWDSRARLGSVRLRAWRHRSRASYTQGSYQALLVLT